MASDSHTLAGTAPLSVWQAVDVPTGAAGADARPSLRCVDSLPAAMFAAPLTKVRVMAGSSLLATLDANKHLAFWDRRRSVCAWPQRQRTLTLI